LDYLVKADIAVYTNTVSMSDTRVSWHSIHPDRTFLTNRGDPCLQEYKNWLESGAYSALLFDGALLQITYDVENGEIFGHRLAYVPCPYRLDPGMVQRDPIVDLIELHEATEPNNIILRSVIRFDFDPSNAGVRHPAAHMTINSSSCRIACVAPMHVGRFVDFVFRNFYSNIWLVHERYFSGGARRDIGRRTIIEEDKNSPHIWWN
jgi:hypothetical protein